MSHDNTMAFKSIFDMMLEDAMQVVNYAEVASTGQFYFNELEHITERSLETTSYLASSCLPGSS